MVESKVKQFNDNTRGRRGPRKKEAKASFLSVNALS